jgi:hypothetical protein
MVVSEGLFRHSAGFLCRALAAERSSSLGQVSSGSARDDDVMALSSF